jgi:hypothetical protein
LKLCERWSWTLPQPDWAEISQQLAELLGPPARAAGLVAAIAEFNLGKDDHDFRVPDGGLHRGRPTGVWQPTAALVIEIVSPGDESWEKLPCSSTVGSSIWEQRDWLSSWTGQRSSPPDPRQADELTRPRIP